MPHCGKTVVPAHLLLSWKSLRVSSFGLCRLFFPILWRRIGFERTEKLGRDGGNSIDCSQERLLIRLRWLVKSADLSDELEGGISNLVSSDGWIEVEKYFDISAH